MMIPFARLAEACEHVGYPQSVHDPCKFENKLGNMLFFSPSDEGEVDLQFALEDVAACDPDVVDAMKAILIQLLSDS